MHSVECLAALTTTLYLLQNEAYNEQSLDTADLQFSHVLAQLNEIRVFTYRLPLIQALITIKHYRSDFRKSPTSWEPLI